MHFWQILFESLLDVRDDDLLRRGRECRSHVVGRFGYLFEGGNDYDHDEDAPVVVELGSSI